jgi:hypothetical protein
MKKVVPFLIFALITGLAAAQDNSLLWKISGKGLTKKSYLFGSLKFMGEKQYYVPVAVSRKLDEVTHFAAEHLMTHHERHELNKELHLPKGDRLSSHMSADDYARLKKLFHDELNVPESSFDARFGHLIPLVVSINMTRLAQKEPFRYPDIELLNDARKRKKKIRELESAEREAEALRNYPLDDQVQALLHSVDNFEVQCEEFRKMEEAYHAGDLMSVFRYTLHPTENNPRFLEEFYYKRNLEWVPRIEALIRQNSTLISVGVSHLEGDQGLLALLRERGYTLTALPLK